MAWERYRRRMVSAPGSSLSVTDRVTAELVRALAAMPHQLQRLLAGGPVRIDGQELHPEVQLLLRVNELLPEPSLEELSPADARAKRLRQARMFAGAPIGIARAEEMQIPGRGGPLRARLYVPEQGDGPKPLLVYLHGGGWVIGDLDTHDNVCRFLAREAGVSVLAIDYRLAPEHPFPAAVDDALAGFRFAVDHAAELGADPARIAIGGDSAGGNLAAVVSQLAKEGDHPAPAFTLMFYPVMDLSQKRRSYDLFGEGFFLTDAEMDWFRGHYLPDEDSARDPRASPLLAGDHAGLPPAYIATAGFDILRDEAEEYARRLREAGVAVAVRRHPGFVHGLINALGVGRTARTMLHEAAGALRVGLAGRATG